MHRDSWLHVGGSVAINEAQYYAPGSYYLSGQYPSAPLYPREEQQLRRSGLLPHGPHAHHSHGVGGDWGNHPTGETCGSSFWTRINQRLHRLFPDVETYVAEIERSIYNVALANQGVNGSGIRYFTNLHEVKEDPTMIGELVCAMAV